MSAFIYVIQSTKNDSYYVGSAEDVLKRLRQHNAGGVASTKYKRPYKLVFSQEFDSIIEAKKAEKKIKSWKRKDFIEKIIADGKLKFLDA